jgi:CRP-like cAMP-binding protein
MTPSLHDFDIANRLLLSLPSATLKRLVPALTRVKTTRGQVIDHLDGSIANLYFINQGLVSLVKTMRDGRTVEIEAVGIEGVTDPSSLFGLEAALAESIVQIPGDAYRIKRDVLAREVDRDDALRNVLQNYVRLAISRIMQTAACNRLHSLEERCCRWLLISHDSARSDTFPLTHEFLAMMLGAQRAGVSIAASFLQKAGYIRYTRGRITITDRPGLENAACECYSTIRNQLDRLFGPPKRQRRR